MGSRDNADFRPSGSKLSSSSGNLNRANAKTFALECGPSRLWRVGFYEHFAIVDAGLV
jgi:hypothetical protein